ncbi:3'-5' exonuclease [Streptomyces violascens]|uniref:3'-5' exonuclease n=1 Tax=Streptomyces violascens TaxID=67381 RepID=UPI0036597894
MNHLEPAPGEPHPGEPAHTGLDPDPRNWADIFTVTVDTVPVNCIRPIDTDRPTWGIYKDGHHTYTDYLGTLHARTDSDGLWHVQKTQERHTTLADAIRTLRRPQSWQAERERVVDWARAILNDTELLLVDVQTTGLSQPWAVQIGALDHQGRILLDETINPDSSIDPRASALHGITTHRVVSAPTFADLLPQLTNLVTGKRCLAYNVAFDKEVFRRELLRHHRREGPVRRWLAASRWEDAMRPCAVAAGLWSAKYGTYQRQRMGGCYDAVRNCRILLDHVRRLAQ